MTNDNEDIRFGDESQSEEEVVEEIPKEQRVLRTQAYDKAISDIVSMIRAGDVILDPDYQRNYIWDNKRASLLVESILLNVPIPVVYVSEEEDGAWSVVDGLQRLNSLRRFFDNEFRLRGLEVLTELNGSQYSTLNPKAARILRNGILRMILIFKESNPEIKYDIFMRLNRGAVKLTEQELRNCLYRGPFTTLLLKLREDSRFLGLLGLEAPHRRFADAELILRYFAFADGFDPDSGQMIGYSGKVKTALNRYCDKARRFSGDELSRLREQFEGVLEKAVKVLGLTAFQRINPDGSSDGRVNRALMDCVLLSFGSHPLDRLVMRAEQVKAELAALPMRDGEFEQAITFATSDKRRVEYRLNTWSRALANVMRD